MRDLIRMGLALAMAATSSAATAQDIAGTYPNRPIRIVVPATPGGPTDFVARAIGQKLTEAWGQPVVIDNRAGAGGNIGNDLVAKSPPDGYTLLVSNFGLIIAPFVYSKLSYDPVKDLAPVTLAATSWFFLVVHPSVPATSVSELIALAKTKADQLTFSSSGNASPSHLAAALFQSVAGVKLTHVPYKGGAPSIAAVIGGEVQIAIESPVPLLPHVKSGKLRALGAARPNRSPLLPDVPTFKEAGLAGFEVGSWYGVNAPAGMPKAIINKLNAEMVKAIQMPELRDRFAAVGADIIANSPDQFGAFLAVEMKKWGKVIQATGVKVD